MKPGEYIPILSRGLINSYSQVFFSDNYVFSAILILVSFIDPGAGLGGLVSVLITNLVAVFIGFNKEDIRKGLFGFNSLLVGLGLGYFFSSTVELYIIILIASVFTLFLVTFFKGVLQKYGLPYLSLPFIFGIWMVFLSAKYLGALGVSERGIYTLNSLYGLGGTSLVNLYEIINNIQPPESVKIYLTSMGAIFFQFSLISGILISIGLIIYSRIAFVLSIYGFYTAYYFYKFLGGNLSELSYSYIGFNYILTAIAIGGYFLIPTKKTFFWLLILIPIVTLLTIGLTGIFGVWRLSIYSLPFNIVVLLFLYALKFRYTINPELAEVMIQQNSPEKNLYSFHNQKLKAYHRQLIPFTLPFFGEWTVNQAHNGEFTHKADWRFAWDFVITGQDNQQYKHKGDNLKDYYCYEKAVLSPGDGVVEKIVDDIPDNDVGQINTAKNWGNTVIIKHTDHLYSSLNHLREGSVIVKPGEKIKAGQQVAKVGNSGRSPYPHLHFQFQNNPYIGSKTMYYPLSYYILNNHNNFIFKSFDTPEKDCRITNIKINPLLKNAFNFIPGQKITMKYTIRGLEKKETWTVNTNVFNASYLYSEEKKSSAWFINDGSLFNFTHFEGNRNSLLYYFYLGFYKVLQGYYKNLSISDEVPQNISFKGIILVVQDFLAPFWLFLKSKYLLEYLEADDEIKESEIKLRSYINLYALGIKLKIILTDIVIDNNGIKSFRITEGKNNFYAEIE